MKKIVLFILSGLLIFSACDKDFGDKNVNPNGAADVNLASMLSGAIMRYGTLTGREYLTKPVLYVQYMAQVTYTDEMLYNNAPSSWYGLYVQTLSNLQTIINVANDEANWTSDYDLWGARVNQLGVAMIMKAVIYKQITDAFGDVPFSEALNPEIDVPKYDTQQSIYTQLIADVKAARDMLDASKLGPTGDPIYFGDVSKWQRFANSLLMSLGLQLTKADMALAQETFEEAYDNLAGAITSVADEAWFTYDVPHNFNNPWNAMRPTDYFLTQEFTDALHGNADLNPTSNTTDDLRRNVLFDDPDGDGLPYGYNDGSGAGKVSMSSNIWSNDPPMPLMTAAYTHLNIAEAAARGWNVTTGTAGDHLRAGILASYASISAHWGDIGDDGTTYAAARVADMTTATGGALQVIGEEKWVALFPKGFDAWSEWRRTGYPMLTPAADAQNGGTIARRLVYPFEEAGLNPNGYNQGVAGLNPAQDINEAKVWWDQ